MMTCLRDPHRRITRLYPLSRRCALAIALLFALIASRSPAQPAAGISDDDLRLKTWLKRFPEADANGDGVLTAAEAQTYLKVSGMTLPGRAGKGKGKAGDESGQAAKGGDKATSPSGKLAAHTEMIAARDGVKLATDYYLPSGKGPWPAIVMRTPYNRRAAKQAQDARGYTGRGYVYVVQDLRGLFESEGKFDNLSGSYMIDDGYDTVEWVARQPWCNGKVGVTGGSGPGTAAKMAVVSNPPHLVAAQVSVCATRSQGATGFNGGVLRMLSVNWMSKRGVEIPEWPKPHLAPSLEPKGPTASAPTTGTITAAVRDAGGWYDIFTPGTLDDFAKLDNGKYRLTMMAKAHGMNLQGLKYPPQNLANSGAFEWFDYWLKGVDNGVMKTPPMRYYLMGDTMTPGAPGGHASGVLGNVWKQADRWPVASAPASYYFTKDGGLQTAPPSDQEASLAFAYDPRNPVRTIGGANLGEPSGPMDQRPLKDRKDILRFVSAPLDASIEITGKVLVELFIDTDVPDTTFMAKFIDVYPDGYEALTLDSAIMARYWNGFDKPAPLEKGKVYKLTVDLFSTALVLNKGHRIGVHITSSNSPRFEVHPNSFEPVNSYDNAPVAHNSVHASSQYPSRLILPVVAPGTSKDYTP